MEILSEVDRLYEAIDDVIEWLDYDVWPEAHPELERDVKALRNALLHQKILLCRTTIDPQQLINIGE